MIVFLKKIGRKIIVIMLPVLLLTATILFWFRDDRAVFYGFLFFLGVGCVTGVIALIPFRLWLINIVLEILALIFVWHVIVGYASGENWGAALFASVVILFSVVTFITDWMMMLIFKASKHKEKII